MSRDETGPLKPTPIGDPRAVNLIRSSEARGSEVDRCAKASEDLGGPTAGFRGSPTRIDLSRRILNLNEKSQLHEAGPRWSNSNPSSRNKRRTRMQT